MLIKTHLIIALFFVLVLISFVENKIIFVFLTLFATILPDIDNPFSRIGKKKFLKFLQFFVNHRGLLHSFSFAFIITLFFVLFFPFLAFGFFLGYSIHLLTDSLTIRGIYPFYPSKRFINGSIRTGGKRELIFSGIFLFFDIFLIIIYFF